ncbi:MAG TPA: flagellar biosynthesis anti-sigma factor FlgM [Candidatus Tectomicrobia bacterium]|nr:flagellar biosynthesis anti-sigma factor FlgM [Candidatus Tectomicrobia bacterium]
MHCRLDRGEIVPPRTWGEEHPDAPDRPDLPPEGQQESSQSLACTSAAREAKVRELQDAIKNGTYRVPAEQLADKMLRDALRDQLP